MYINTIEFYTTEYNQWILLTDKIEEMIQSLDIKNGFVTIMTKHTTTGITINESLECLESDLDAFLARMAPEDYPYAHARMLHSYGSTAGNPTGHIKAHLTGNHCHFVIENSKLVKGEAQDVYFCEFDGPSHRKVIVVFDKMHL